MRHYEIVVMLSAEQQERGALMAQRYQDMVTDGGGKIHRFEDWGSRSLAYPINKKMRARYFLFNIECGADVMDKLKDDFRFSESVIRTLVLRRDEAIVDESPIMKQVNSAAEESSDDNAAAADSADSTDSTAEATADDAADKPTADNKEESNNEEKK